MKAFNTLRKLGKDKEKEKSKSSNSANATLVRTSNTVTMASKTPAFQLGDYDFAPRLTSDVVDIHTVTNDGFAAPPTVLAYDTLQSILAVGCDSGHIKLYGKTGLERSILLHSKMAVRRLLFLTPEPLLVSIDGNDKIYVWQIDTLRLYGSVPRSAYLDSTSAVTAIALLPGSAYFFVGTSEGAVMVFDGKQCKRTFYVAACQAAGGPSPVISIAAHPEDANQLLIGYQSGEVALWDFRGRKASRMFAMAGQSMSLTALAWHPLGRHFACGYSSGQLVVWDVSSNKPAFINAGKEVASQGDHHLQQLEPLTQLRWCSLPQVADTLLVAVGGTPTDEMQGITVLHLLEGKVRKSNLIASDRPIIALEVTGSSFWQNGCHEPGAIIALVQQGGLRAFDINRGLHRLAVPGSIAFSLSPICCMRVYANAPRFLADALAAVPDGGPSLAWPLTGGGFAATDAKAPAGCDILVTAHTDNSIRFWDARSLSYKLLYTVQVAVDDVTLPPNAISSFDFCVNDVLLAVGLSDGLVLLYEFVTQSDLADPVSNSREATGNLITVLSPTKVGLNPIVRMRMHKSAVTVVRLATVWGLLATGDSSGVLSVINLASAEVVFTRIMTSSPTATAKAERQMINHLSFSYSYPSESSQEPHCLLWAGADGGVFAALRITRMGDDALYFHNIMSFPAPEPAPCVLIAVLDENGASLGPHKDFWPPVELDAEAEATNAAAAVASVSANGAGASPSPSASLPTLHHPPHFVVVVAANQIRVHLNSISEVKVAKASPEDEDSVFVNARIVTKMHGVEGTCLVALTSDGSVCVYSLPRLELIQSTVAADDEKVWRLRQACFTDDGRLFLLVADAEIARVSLFLDENVLGVPDSLPIMYNRRVVAPPRPNAGLMKTLMGGFMNTSPADLAPLFDVRDVQMEREKERAQRDDLMDGRGKSSSSTLSSPGKPPQNAATAAAMKESGTAAQAIQAAAKNLQERGQKLSELGDKASELSDSALHFSEMARQMRMREENKKWYEL